MKKLNKIKLNQFSNAELETRKMNAIKGRGCSCTFSCSCSIVNGYLLTYGVYDSNSQVIYSY